MRRHGLRARIRQQRRLFQRLATRHALARRGHAGVRMLEAIGEWIDDRPHSVRFVPPLADTALAPTPFVIDVSAELADSMVVSDATSDAAPPSPPEPYAAAEARTRVGPQHHAVGSLPSAHAHGAPSVAPLRAAILPNDPPYAARPGVAAEVQPSAARDDSAAVREPDQLRSASPVAVTATTSAGSEPPRAATAAAPNVADASGALPAAASPPAPPASEHDMVVRRALAALRKSGELPPTPRTTAEPPREAVAATSTRSARPAPDRVTETTSSQARPADAGAVLAAPEQPADSAGTVVNALHDATPSLVAEHSDIATRATSMEVATETAATTPPAPAPPAPTAAAPSPPAEVEPTGTGRIDERRQARRPAHLPANRSPSASGADAPTAPNVPTAPPRASNAAGETSGQFQFTDVGRTPQEWRQLLIESLQPPTPRSARGGHATRVEPTPSAARGAQVDAKPAAAPRPAGPPMPVPAPTPTRTPTSAIAEPRGTPAGARRVPPAAPAPALDVPHGVTDRVPGPAWPDVRHAAEHARYDERDTSRPGSGTSTTDASMPEARAPGAAPPNTPTPGEPASVGSASDAAAAPPGSTQSPTPLPGSARQRSDALVADGHVPAPAPIDRSGEPPASTERPTEAPRIATDVAEWTDEEEADVRPGPAQTAPATANRAGGAPPPSARTPEPLLPSARRFLQPLVGIDPDTVRIHRDERAARVAAAHDADAVAVGDDIELGAGHDDRDPATIALVAHELTHVARARTHRFVPPVARGSWSPRHAPSALGATNVRGMDATSASVSASPADEETVARVTEARVHDAAARERAVSVTTAVEPDVAKRVPGPGRQATPHRHALTAAEAAAQRDAPNAGVPNGLTRVLGDPWGGLPAPWEPLPAFLTDGRQRVAAPSATPEAADAPNGRSTADAAPVVVHRAERGLGRAGEEPAHAETPPADAGGPDLDALARQVYDVLRRRLAAERRRGA